MTKRSIDYALLAKECYEDPKLDDVFDRNGVSYAAIDTIDVPAAGFQAVAYERHDTHEIVIAYRGTEFNREPLRDGGVDAGMVFRGLNAQQADAAAFTQRVLDFAAKESERAGHPIQVTVTGHSLGGALAQINAAKFGLRGETFNAYGAASLFGVPTSSTDQVINHVSAMDPVSAASPHFGEVRVYAEQQDIDSLTKAGYHSNAGVLWPRNPLTATDFKAHGIDNFVPDSDLFGYSILDPENQARHRAHEDMIERYRNDVLGLRTALSAEGQVRAAVTLGAVQMGSEIGQTITGRIQDETRLLGEFRDAAVGRATAACRAVSDVRNELMGGIASVQRATGHTMGEQSIAAWDKQISSVPRIDHAEHPDHALFQQARVGVHALDRQHGRTPDNISERIAAALTAAAKVENLKRIDQVGVSDDGNRLYAVQGDARSAFKRFAEVDAREAAATSVEMSSHAIHRHGQEQQHATQGRLVSQVAGQERRTHVQPSP